MLLSVQWQPFGDHEVNQSDNESYAERQKVKKKKKSWIRNSAAQS